MILVDTSIIVAWLDSTHENHARCEKAMLRWAAEDRLAISAVTYAELAAGGRTQEAVDEELAIFDRVEVDFASAWRAGVAFRRFHPGKDADKPVLPDFLIRAQASAMGWRHLTNDRRRLHTFPEGEFLFPED